MSLEDNVSKNRNDKSELKLWRNSNSNFIFSLGQTCTCISKKRFIFQSRQKLRNSLSIWIVNMKHIKQRNHLESWKMINDNSWRNSHEGREILRKSAIVLQKNATLEVGDKAKKSEKEFYFAFQVVCAGHPLARIILSVSNNAIKGNPDIFQAAVVRRKITDLRQNI